MGLAEQLKAGASLERKNVTVLTAGTGSVALGSAYMILEVQTDIPCRLRLYDNQSSRDDATEQARAFGSSNIADSISLVADLSMSSAGGYTIDPVLYGVSGDLTNAYYRVDGAVGNPTILFRIFPLDDSNFPATPSTAYSLDNRRTLTGITGSLLEGELHYGTIVASSIPKTYLLVSASLDVGSHKARVRLYRSSGSISDANEQARPISTEPSSSVDLLVDVYLTGSTTTYFTPKIIGANLQNMGTNLSLIKGSTTAIQGKSELYYIIENINTSGGEVPISASFNVFALED